DARMWHIRLGYPGPDPTSHFIDPSTGVRLERGPPMTKCEECAQAKITSQISRIPRPVPFIPGEIWAIDFLDLKDDPDKFSSLMLFTDRCTGFILDIYLKNRDTPTVLSAIIYFLGVLEHRFKTVPKAFESDNELTKSKAIKEEVTTNRFI
ncbi:hypothetical protein QBC37DRAFT_242743, partial [Rhypophila decipiens]